MKLAGLVLVGLASGCLGDAMVGPRRIQRQGRSLQDLPVDWEYGGWRPLQTPKGFYRRISRNLLKDDEGQLLNEVASDTDPEASTWSEVYHAPALEDFLKAGSECGGCGFQPMIFNNRAKRRARSAPPIRTIDTPQRIDSHQDDRISIVSALKQKKLERSTNRRDRRDVNQISASVAVPPTAAEASDVAKDEGLDQAKIDKISENGEEPHFLSPKAILDLATKITQAVAHKGPTSSEAAPTPPQIGTKTSDLFKQLPKSDSVEEQPNRNDDSPRFLRPASVAGAKNKTSKALVHKPEKQQSKENPLVSATEVQGEAHFLSPASIYGVLTGIADAAGKAKIAGETAQSGVRSRTKRQIWNPFRRRQANPKPSGGPYGFVIQNIPYEAQSSIDDFNFAQSIPQSAYQSSGFQGVQTFGPPSHPPPITNFNKVSSIDFQKPLLPQEFAPQFVPEHDVIGPVPTRPVTRPEQVQPTKHSVPPPQVIDEILGQYQRTGKFPADLSPETALLIAEIISGKKENAPMGPVEAAAPEVDVPLPYQGTPKPVFHRDPPVLPEFHTKPLSSRPFSFGSLPAPLPKPPSYYESSRNKMATPTDASHSTSLADMASQGHDGGHLNSANFHRPHTVTSVTTRRRKKPPPPLTGTKISQAEKAAEHAVEKDHRPSIYPQEHVHVHHHHKKKKKRPSEAPAAVLSPVNSPSEVLLAPPEHKISEVHEPHLHHTSYDSSLDGKVHLDAKPAHGVVLAVEAELGADTRPRPVTMDPLQTIDDAPSEKPDVNNAEYYDDFVNRKATSAAPATTVPAQWPVDDPFLNPTTSTEGPRTVGPEDILIQDAKPGIPLMASDLNSLKVKTKNSDSAESLPQPVFRPDIQTKKANEAAKQATQDEDDISAGAGAIHFQPIQTTDGDANSATGNAQLYHAYYAPAHHDPPPGYIRMTVDEFNKLFKDAEIQFIGSEQELQKKLGMKPTNKLNFDITKEAKDDDRDAADVKDSEKESKDGL